MEEHAVEEYAVEWFAINSAELLGRFMVSYTYIRTIVEGESQIPKPHLIPDPLNLAHQSPKCVALLTPTKGPGMCIVFHNYVHCFPLSSGVSPSVTHSGGGQVVAVSAAARRWDPERPFTPINHFHKLLIHLTTLTCS